MSFRLRAMIVTFALFGLSALSCGRELRVRLVLGVCDVSQMDWATVLAVRAELKRDRDGMTDQSNCLATGGKIASLADLERILAGGAIFNDLPAEGGWTVRVQGFFTETCLRKASLVCGRLVGVDLGGASTIPLPIDCAPRVATAQPQTFKECIDDL